MKFNYLVKATPFLTTLLLIIFLSINNQKDYTKLRLIIWNTPTLSVGKYIAISTGTGFIISYLITTYLAKINQKLPKQTLKFKEINKYENKDEHIETSNNQSYDNTLIDRDIKDPSPTINASFRIIGKTDSIKENYITNNEIQYNDSIEFEDQYDEELYNNKTINQERSISTDWDDNSFLKW